MSDAGHRYTRIDDMEGTTIPWIGFAGTTPNWGTHTDPAQNASISPVRQGTWSCAPVPTPYETFPGTTSAHAARLRTIQPVVNAYGATMHLVFAEQNDAGLKLGRGCGLDVRFFWAHKARSVKSPARPP